METGVLAADVIGDAALVLIVSRLSGAVARRLGQPAVVGQIAAGILLGPSFLGRLPGHLTSRLFPHAVLPSLTVLSQVAIVIFMFGVGHELDRRLLSGRPRAVPLIAAGALLVPMGLGAGSVLLFKSDWAAVGQPHITRSFVLFIGVALSITALPVLAAIVRDRGIAGTSASTVATAAAGLMDVAAWLALAVALTGTAARPGRPVAVTLLLVCAFGAIMLLAVRPVLRWWFSRPAGVMSNKLAVAPALALVGAWVTASLGLQPVFGGFLAGLTMPGPGGNPDAEILRPMEEIGDLLLPLFFVVTGLSVNVAGLHRTASTLLALVCGIAILGKLGPAYVLSRVGGLERRNSAVVAILLNTRGLTELIALNVGLSAGLINQQIFSVLVFMALITTALTAPLLKLARAPKASPSGPRPRPAAAPGAVGVSDS